jgi:hypothetical protein
MDFGHEASFVGVYLPVRFPVVPGSLRTCQPFIAEIVTTARPNLNTKQDLSVGEERKHWPTRQLASLERILATAACCDVKWSSRLWSNDAPPIRGKAWPNYNRSLSASTCSITAGKTLYMRIAALSHQATWYRVTQPGPPLKACRRCRSDRRRPSASWPRE